MSRFSIFLCVLVVVALLQRSEGRWHYGVNDMQEYPTTTVKDVIVPVPMPKGACHCENASCSCCVREFRKKICTSLYILERADEEAVVLQFNLTIDQKLVLAHVFTSDDIPPLCYHGVIGLGVCGKITTRDEDDFKICSTLQIVYDSRVVKEIDLHCLSIPKPPNNIETTPAV